VAVLLTVIIAGVPAAHAADPIINEFVFNHTGSDIYEFIEVWGDPSTDYSALTVLEIEGDSTGAGTVDGVFPVGTTSSGGFWFSGFINGQIENGSVTLLMVEGFSGAAGNDLDTNNDGTLDSEPWSRVVDGIAVSDGGSSDQTYASVVLVGGFDGVSFTVGGASRIPNGTDTNTVGDWMRNDFDGAGLPGFAGTPTVGEALNTPDAENQTSGAAADPVINEFVFNHTGPDTSEFIEVWGDPSTDYSALTILEIEGDSTGAGTVDGVFPIGTTSSDGFWVSGFLSNQIENGSVTLLMVEDFSGATGDDLDTDNDGTLDSAPWSRVVDGVAVSDGGSSDRTYASVVLVGGFDGVSFTVGGASRIPNGTDTDATNDWMRNDFDGEGLPGFIGTPTVGEALNTPDQNNQEFEVRAELVINEILQNPSAVSDSNGEWFELVNPGPDPVDIDGWTIKDNDFDAHVIANGGPLVIPAGGFLVLGRHANTGANGGVAIDYQYSGVFLSNSSDELILLDTSLSEIDRVEWDNGATFPDPNGASMALKFPVLDNNIGANWCESKTPFGAGDLGTPGAPNDCLAGLVINEVDADQTSIDDAEFIEIFDGGDGGTDLSGLVVVLYNGSDDASYTPAIDLDGFSTNGDGFFVICGDAANVPGCDLDVSPDTNLVQNGADAVALYAGEAANFPNDTPLTSDGLLDALVYDTNDGDDPGLLVLLNSGQPQVNEGGQGEKDLHSNQRCPNGFGGQLNTDSYFQDTPTAGGFNNCPPLEIFEIQGDGLASPYDGFVVGTDGDVVTALAPNGFFMQTPSAGTDGDINTSDGIFVFTGGAPGVAVGDLVDVEGEVNEFFGFTEIRDLLAVSTVGSGSPPPAVVFDAGVPTPNPLVPSCALEFECYEGMLVDVADGTVTGPNQRFGTDPIAEVHITAAPARTFREPGVEFPGLSTPPIPTWDGNPEVFELDLDRLGLPNMIIPAGSAFSATGVLGFEFGGYELWPTQATIYAAPLPVPVSPRQPLEFTVGSLNMFRFFDHVDDPKTPNANGDVIRNDFVVSAAEYERRRDKFVSYIVDVLDAPDILAVQEAEKIEVLQDLAAAINTVEPNVVYTAHLIEGNDVGTIDVGFLTRDTIAVDAVTQYGYSEILSFDGSLLNDRPPLMLEARCVSDGADIPIKVIVVHNRSLNSIDDPDDGPRVRQKRLEQAQFVAQLVQDEQTADPNVELVVVGDFNAFEFTDGYVDVVGQVSGDFDTTENLLSGADLVDPDLTKWVTLLPQSERYSFIFRGNAQALDHALTTVGLDPRVTNFEFGRGNADAAVDLINDGTTPEYLPLRSSDHDGFVLYLTKDLDGDGVVDNLDSCPDTVIPESVPTQRLGTNRWALVDEDDVFDTTKPNGRGGGLDRSFTLEDTAGCSCEQIIEELDLGRGHVKYGCSTSAMEDWIAAVGE
jgi:predicted extracellular nuclease